MQAGRLRHRLVIEQKAAPVSQDSFGEEEITWETVATVWGSVEPLRGREFIEARQEHASVDTRIRVRHRDGVGPEMRVTWGSHVYDVLSVIRVMERQREMQLMCREIL